MTYLINDLAIQQAVDEIDSLQVAAADEDWVVDRAFHVLLDLAPPAVRDACLQVEAFLPTAQV